MKKVVLLLAAVLLSMSAMAQVRFGVKAGFDMTNFWGSDTKHGMQPNYQIGGLLEYQFNNKFAIAPELVFAGQGGKFNHTTYNVNYINVPVMLKYKVADKFSVDLGPQLGINVYSKYTEESGSLKNTVDYKDHTKAIDFGIGLGGTYDITENAFVQARYTFGVTNVYDGGGDIKNGNIQFAFGWKF